MGRDRVPLSRIHEEILLEIGDALRPLADAGRIQAEACRGLGTRLGADRVFYAEVAGPFDVVIDVDYHADGVAPIVGRYDVREFGRVPVEALRAGRPWVVPNVEAVEGLEDPERAAFARLGMAAAVKVPLVKQDRVEAFLAVHQRTPRDWTPDEVTLIEEVAERTWAAVERARAESALRESEERFRLMIQTVQDYAMFMMDVGGFIVSWNEGAERILGYAEPEIIGQSGAIFFTPEDRARGAHERELQTARDTGRASDENWLVRKSGEWFWANGATTALRDEGGALRGYTKILRDLSDRKAAEDALREYALRLRTALDAARMGTWLWDIRADRQMLDEGLSRLAGLPEGAAVGTLDEFAGLAHPDDQQAIKAAFREAAERGTGFRIEFRIPQPDGSVRWLRDHGDILTDEAGRPVYLTGAAVDITERKLAELELQRLNAELDHRVRERTRELQEREERLRALTAQSSRVEHQERQRLARLLHDHVQQLLVAAKMRVGVAALDVGGPVRENLDAAVAILNDSIDATRNLSVQLAPPLLHDQGLPAALEWLVSRMSKQHGLTVEASIDEEANPSGEEERDILFQAAQEFLLNVAKHAGSRTVEVQLAGLEEEIWLEVCDHGRGFDAGRALDREGSFGLFQVRQRLESIGGTLAIEHPPGGGTCASATIPSARKEPSGPAGALLPPLVIPTGQPPAVINVVLVDDHQLVREGLSQLISRQPDINVVGEAANGEAGVAVVLRVRPDVVVMDVNMPVMNGIEATRRIVGQFPDVRVIGLSLDEAAETSKAMREAGAVKFLSKDSAPANLVQTIRDVSRRDGTP